MSNGGVRLQNLRDCTVQIRHAKTGAIVGTGIAVSMDGKIVTCAHVVLAAGVNPRTGERIPTHWEMILKSIPGRESDSPADAEDAEVGVYFPQARGGEEKERRARVVACFPHHDDDVVLLQLTDGPPPLAPEQIAVLGTAKPAEGHPFRSYGYRRLGRYQAGYAYGMILGCVECPPGLTLRADPVQLQSRHIAAGMSGSAVLDMKRNLVVGLIAERWPPGKSPIDDDIGWGVDAYVLTFDPFILPVRDEPLPLGKAPEPKTDVEAAQAEVAPRERIAWNNAPAPLEKWVGREELLRAISRDWADPDRRVTGLIGFGGEGKSSLARQAVENILEGDSPPLKSGEGPGVGAAPDGVFWWGFYTRPSVDEFFEAALDYMSGGRIDPRKVPSASVRAQIIGAMLGAGRYLFILDGLEVMQHQEGDQYGLLQSADLRQFLSYFAAPGHPSFCLITGRATVLDLMEYTTYNHRDVTRLSPADGRALLHKVGVKGPDEDLDKVVADWDGHALTLSLLGGYLAEQHEGDVAHIGEIPPPTADEPRYDRVHRVLRRYDEHLTEAERAFLTLFSAFRTPVAEMAFDKVFRVKPKKPGFSEKPGFSAPIAALDDAAFQAMVQRLVAYRILRYDPREGHYTAHPLIRSHYAERLKEADQAWVQDAHQRIKDYYLDLAGGTPANPKLDDLAPLIEAVHHACRAGAYDEAIHIVYQRIYQGYPSRVLVNQLGAYETALALMQEFFPGGDTSQEPQVSNPQAKYWILNEAGLCLMNLGRLGEAPPFFERYVAGNIAAEDWQNASIGYQNLAELHAHLGELAASAEAACQALALARRAENERDECDSLKWQAWAAHLRGDLEAAGVAFGQAEALEREITPQVRYLYSLRGIQHADHLRRLSDPSTGSGQAAAYARRVTEANLEICEQNRFINRLSLCHRVLGDLDADTEQHDSARGHYDQALKIARDITLRQVLIEALLARGRWTARYGDLTGLPDPSGLAFSDLNEALGYAVDGGYRIYEADIRVALAWAHLAAGEPNRARQEAERAQRMSADMGYHWGQVDAAEVLAALSEAAAKAMEHPE
ncbi:MAG: trypsin-like peptidase domain-containing protein [Promethearchaeota archaeon]